MSHVEITSKVDGDGILRISLPFGLQDANREVRVVVDPVVSHDQSPKISREQWRDFVRTMAGCISDPTFQRPDQGEYERRSIAFP
jgi:hypothetical protein